MQTRSNHLIHGGPIGLDVPLDLEECEYSFSSEISVISLENSEGDERTPLNAANVSPVHVGRVFTFRHCKQVAPTFDVQPVVIQLVISQPPQAVFEILEKITALGFISEGSDATPATAEPPKSASLHEIFSNPWDPIASADEDFGRRATQVWRRDFSAMNPTLAEEPSEYQYERIDSSETLEQEQEQEVSLHSMAPEDCTLANFRPSYSVRPTSTMSLPAMLPSDSRSTEMLKPWNTSKRDSKCERLLPLYVKLFLWIFVLLPLFLALLWFLPAVVSRSIEAYYYEPYEPQESFYFRWAKTIMMGLHTVFVGLFYL